MEQAVVDLQTAVGECQTAVQSIGVEVAKEGAQVTAAIQALQDQLNQGQTITAADLEPITASVQTITAAAQAAQAAVAAIFNPPATEGVEAHPTA